MISDMAYFLLAILCVIIIHLLLTTSIGTVLLPFLDTSRQEVRDLFLRLKDLALPMGSFPSRLLGFRTSDISEDTTNSISQETHEGKKYRTRSIITQPHIGSAPLNKKRFDSEEDQDVSFLHTLVHQSCHIDNTDTSTSGVETGAPSEAVEDATEVVYNANEAAGNGPTIPTATEETLGLISTELSRMATEKETLMAYIRQMTDPEGSHGLAVLNLNQLVQWMMNEHERSTNDLRMQNNRREDEMYDARQAFEAIVIGQNLAMQEDRQAMILARREASELRIQNNIREDECYDARQVFEAIIVGQNLAMQEDRQDRILAKQEASELKVENSKLREAQEKYEELEAEWKGRIRYAQERAEGERLSADEARAGVESRISQLKKAHAEEISAAAFKSFQERNSIICSRRMVQDDLTIARSQVAAWEQRYEATVKNNNLVVKDLNGSVRRLELEVETTKELAESTERDLRKRLEEQGKEKDRKIGLLKDQQRKLTREVETLSGRLVSAEHSYQRLSDFVKEQKETDREERQYMKNSLNHDIKRLERVVEANEVTIQNLEGRIAGLESGQELEDLKAEARSHLHHCSNQIHNLTQQNQFLEQEIAGLKRTSENRDREIHQNKGQWIAEKTALEQALKQTKAASLRYQRRTVKKIRAARSDAKSARTEIDRFRREQTQTAEQYQNVVRDAVEVEKKSLQAQATEQYENAVRNAVEVAKKSMQEQFDGERRTYLENTKNETTKTEEGLRTEIGALKSQIDRFTQATEVAGSASAEQSPAGNTDESASLARELDEAHRLLEEIEEQGLPRICGERLLLVELNKARRVLALVKREVQEPQLDKHDLLCALSEAGINEKRFQQCDSSKRPVLLAQARAANEKLQALQKLLRTDLEVPKDAILEILQSPAKNETNGRQEVGDSNMADTSQMQNTTRPGASEITQPPRTPADVLATPQKMSPITPGQAAHPDPVQQQDSGPEGQGSALPSQGKADNQHPLPPLPGLFQPQSADQTPLSTSLLPHSAEPPRKPVTSQQRGEIKMPRPITRQMRQWAKGWVRGGLIERAEALMLQNFPLLQKTLGTGLRSYLVELKEFVEGQAVQDMEQPGGWTQEMTDLVETFYHEGQDVNNITFTIKTHESYAAALAEMQGVEEMDGVDLYIQKLHLDMDSKPVQKPFGWTDEMTGTVMDELRANADTEITYLEEILDAMHGLRIGGLKRYLARVKRDFVAERDHRIQSA